MTNSVAQVKPAAQMTMTEKLQVAVERAATHLGPEAAEKLRVLVTPENLTIMADTTAGRPVNFMFGCFVVILDALLKKLYA